LKIKNGLIIIFQRIFCREHWWEIWCPIVREIAKDEVCLDGEKRMKNLFRKCAQFDPKNSNQFSQPKAIFSIVFFIPI
jgi:hypothetical protein